MELKDARVLHITNNLGYGGVQKIIYEICNVTKESVSGVYVASCGGVYVNRLKQIGVEHFTIPDVSSKSPKDVVEIIHELAKIVRERHINIIQCHHRMAVLFARMIHANAQIVYVNHTTYSDRAKLTHWIMHDIPVIAVGEQAKDNAENFFGVPENRITVIPNAVEEYGRAFSAVEQIDSQRSKGRFIIAFAGRLHPQKGVQYFISAVRDLLDRNIDIACFIIGDGPLRAQLEKQVQELGVQDAVHFMGFRDDVANCMYQSDVVVMSSIYEGLPLTPIEACSLGKAVIAPDIEGVREVVVDGVNGLLFEPCNPHALADAICEVYSNKDELERFSQHAREVYENKFSMKPFREAYLRYYASLLSREERD